MPPAPQAFDAIVLGAGGAGLMCAAIAGQRGRRVLVLDHADRAGKKILISGGGRCNFTNLTCPPERYLSDNPHFATSALSRYTPQDFLELVQRHRIAWHEKTLGQLFCDGSARQIVALLLDECARGGVRVDLGRSIRDIAHADGVFRVTASDGVAQAPVLVLATGGASIPKMGATGFAYDVARQFGLGVVTPRPGLVPLTLATDEGKPAAGLDHRALSGVSVPVVARAGAASFAEACLFTHRGLSGPAILQISSYWDGRSDIALDLLPQAEPDWLVAHKRSQPRATLRSALAKMVPDRLAVALSAALIEPYGASGELANVPDKSLQAVGRRLAAWAIAPSGTEGFAKAEVTVGGIDTAALSSRTMQAKQVPGLYAIGEAVDVTGWLGGYNFQWAWSSGVAAGQAI